MKLTLCGQYEYPSALPQTLLTVSGITFTVFNASVANPLNAYEVRVVNNKGSNDDDEQIQSENTPMPAIDSYMAVPGLLTIIWLPT
jgi:hypothetical protein